MTEPTVVKELKALSDELELYGVPPLLLDATCDLTIPLEQSILPRLIESVWQLMLLQRHTVHSNLSRQDEVARLKSENQRLEMEISLLKRRLSKSTEQAKLATEIADLATRELNNIPQRFDSDFARQKSEALAENEKYQRVMLEKNSEIADLKNKLQSALQNGKVATRTRPKLVPCSERETTLKQVVCKYQEANQLLIEENLSLVRIITSQSEGDEDSG